MTLQKQFEQQLSQLSAGSAQLVANKMPRELRCDVVEQTSLATSFLRLSLGTSELATASAADLERIGNDLSARLTYLMEPISPIENDAQACVMQLRSNPPQRDDDGRTYYELLVRRGGEISLCRYRNEKGEGRRTIPATVTREVLLRLANDFCAALD